MYHNLANALPTISEGERRFYKKFLKKFSFLIFWCCVGLFVVSTNIFSNSRKNLSNGNKKEESGESVNLSNNYFRPLKTLLTSTSAHLVDNDKCTVPDVDPRNPLVLPYMKYVPPYRCNESTLKLTYIAEYKVILNLKLLKNEGFEMNDISCCYKTIERVEQSPLSYTKEADNLFRYSEECYQMSEVTEPISGYIKVTCRSNIPSRHLSYEHYHMIPMLSGETSAQSKLSFWEKCLSSEWDNSNDDIKNTDACRKVLKNGRPPNILLLGFDSTSRLNFRRFMSRTVHFLENVHAHEMSGYTKVGDNTFPNLVPLMSSLSEEELHSACHPDRWIPQDNCPYIWKNFSKQNYLTAHFEDSPGMAIFNSIRGGFLHQPVDVYPRPFMLAAYEINGTQASYLYASHIYLLKNFSTICSSQFPKILSRDCIGYQRPEEMIVEYIADLVALSDSKQLPYFITSWLTDLTHDDMNKIQTADELVSRTLGSLHAKGLLENTVLLVMSDHGYRFLDVRASSLGWLEDKLPVLWIKLPPTVITSYPSWEEALKYNSRQLFTTFDIHETLKQILNAYSIFGSSNGDYNGDDLRGISLLGNLPSRTCEEAGVPKGFCACNIPVEYNNDKEFLKLAGEAVIHHMNEFLPQVCRRFKLGSVTASGIFPKRESKQEDSYPEEIILGLTTIPGNYRIEAWVYYDPITSTFSNFSHLLRINKIKSSTCLSGSDKVYETFCYCHNVPV